MHPVELTFKIDFIKKRRPINEKFKEKIVGTQSITDLGIINETEMYLSIFISIKLKNIFDKHLWHSY